MRCELLTLLNQHTLRLHHFSSLPKVRAKKNGDGRRGRGLFIATTDRMQRIIALVTLLLFVSTTESLARALMSLVSQSNNAQEAFHSVSPVSVVSRGGSADDNMDQHQSSFPLNPRTCILQVGVRAGTLCSVANSLIDNDNNAAALVPALAGLLQDLHQTATALRLNLIVAIQAKLELNRKKYPVELCQGKAGKYTQYSAVTGVTSTNQSTLDRTVGHSVISLSELVDCLPQVATDVADFAEARHWTQFHTPRNLILALLGEVGELAELVQWKGDQNCHATNISVKDDGEGTTPDGPWHTFTDADLDKISQELADVAIYSLRIATVCQIMDSMCEALQQSISGGNDAPQRNLAHEASFD